MLGTLLISHGEMCNGMRNTLSMFFGNDIAQLETVSLHSDMGADEYGALLREKLERVNTGDGVVIFADMLGGTPCNQALQLLGDDIELVVGMNLPIVMEFLALREAGNVNIDELISRSKDSMINAKALFNSTDNSDDEDD